MHKTISHFASALLASAMLCATPASAGFVSGTQLAEICRADSQGAGNPLSSAECLGFILGVADTFDCVEKLHGFNWDSTSDVGKPQLVKTVVAWLDAHPSVLAYEADGLVGAALAEAYPCH